MKDNEIRGTGNSYDFKFRGYDTRLARFNSVDPLRAQYPWNSNYAFAENDVIGCMDLEGREKLKMTDINQAARTAKITIIKEIQISRENLPAYYSNITNEQMRASFPNPSQPLYVRNLPQNSQTLDYISSSQYNEGVGYALNIAFDVNVIYTDQNNMQNADEATKQYYKMVSYVATNSNTSWSSPTTYAAGSQGGIGVDVNPKVPTTGLSASEAIAHEVGYHNMANQGHDLDANNQPIYDVTRIFIGSNQPGKVKTDQSGEDAKQIIQHGLDNDTLEE